MPFIGNLGPTELIIILVIALLVLGPGKLPEVGSALGKSIREFRKAATEVKEATSVDLKTPAVPIVPNTLAARPAPPAQPAPDPTEPAAAADDVPSGSGPETPAS
jgi:sec-independent protein translocase protein TatA